MKIKTPYFAVNRINSGPGHCSVCEKSKPDLEVVELEPFYPIEEYKIVTQALICQECLPQIQLYFDKVRECFDSINHLWPRCSKRWVENDNALQFNNVDWDVTFPITVAELLRDSRYSFLFGLFASCIVGISSAVELSINMDTRMAEEFKSSTWKNLNIQLMNEAQEKGINVHDLLDSGERLDDKKKIRFICRRNKYAHGDVSEWKANKNPLISSTFMENEALNQLLKGQDFLMNWAKSEGNPACYPKKSGERRVMLKAHSDVLSIKFFNPYDY